MSQLRPKKLKLPEGLQITPCKFLVFNLNQKNALLSIDNMTWTTYAITIDTPSWISCQKIFMVQPKSIAEVEIKSKVPTSQAIRSFDDLMIIKFLNMTTKEPYEARIQLQFNSSPSKISSESFQGSLVLFQLSIMLLFITAILIPYHYRFHVKYYLCVFQSILCKFTNEKADTSFFKTIFKC